MKRSYFRVPRAGFVFRFGSGFGFGLGVRWFAFAFLLVPLVVFAQGGFGVRALRPASGNPAYTSDFVFTRIAYGSGLGSFRGFGGSWNHDYPDADLYLTQVLDDLTRMRVRANHSNVLTLTDPAIFDNPIMYISEPGFWGLSEADVPKLRAYLLKGGFVIFDDFEGEQWNNMARNMARALPEHRWIPLELSHPIFHSFFDVRAFEVPHPTVNVPPRFYGMFENNDPNRRMIALANHNSDIAEYWEWSARDMFPVEITSGAYQLGVNWIIYGMTH
jgi:hypothetical protein